MRKSTFVCVLFLLVLSAAVFAGGTSEKSTQAQPAKVDLSYWDMVWTTQDYPQASEELVGAFNKANDKVRIKLQMVDWQSWYEKFVTAVSGGSAPDIATCSSSGPMMFSRMGELVDLSPLLEQWKKDGSYADMLQSSYDAYFLNNIQAAIPWQIDSRCFYYRKDVFAKLGLNPNPKDWFAFIEMLKTIRDKTDLIPLVFAGGDNMCKHFAYQLSIYNDTGMVTKDMKGDFNNPKIKQVLEFVNTLVKEKVIAPGTIGYKDADAQKMYFSGKAAVFFSSVDPQVFNYPDVAGNTGIMEVFTGPSSTTKRSSSFVNPIMAFKQSKHPKEAMAFIDWWSKNNIILFTKGHVSALPTRFSFLKDSYFSSNWLWKEASDKILPYAVAGGVYPLTSEYPAYGSLNGERTAGKALQSVMMGNGTADLAKIQAETNDRIEKAIADAKK